MTSMIIPRYTPPLLLSRSLEGLENVIPPQGYSPSNSNYLSCKLDKPLPDIPRPTSCVYGPDTEAVGSNESHLPNCPRKTMLPQPLPRTVSRAHSLCSSKRYQKAFLLLPTDGDTGKDAQIHVRKRSLSLQSCGYPSKPNPLLAASCGTIAGPTGLYHPDLGWSWVTKSRYRSNSSCATHGGSTTADPILPIYATTVGSIDPSLLPHALNIESIQHRHGREESSESIFAAVDDNVSKTCFCEVSAECEKPEPDAGEVVSNHQVEQQRIMLPPSTSHLPMTILPKNDRNAPTPGTCPPRLEIQPESHYGNRTELYSFSSDSSGYDHNLNITPTPNNTPTYHDFDRRRTKQLAVLTSDCQRYGSKAWKTKQSRRSSIFFRSRITKPKTTQTSSLSPALPSSTANLRQYYRESHHRSQCQLQSQFQQSSSTLLPHRIKSFFSKAFHIRFNASHSKPSRPPRPPSLFPLRYILRSPPLPPPQQQQWQQQQQLWQRQKQRKEQQKQQQKQGFKQQSMGGGALLRRSMSVMRERLGLTGAERRKMTLKDRIVIIGATDFAMMGEETAGGWV
ncbi:hypothetical protein PAAG_00674 [Paracoccidioides lutzii Pb01]|uniref:Uncharacterized protein n=1 Tax=Paracoccidioides lutzii (strain ATCC MYA-826 / Pb01) TaxID=502779 RepID=C1GQ79_PARBA|nr:hypothetical protein PAAG_00674 [Paracoccidioides lutzii Pb01]EEH37753.2 hypothetical protein PAAG_00674 [Paracoccidioides lutzii Pb01]